MAHYEAVFHRTSRRRSSDSDVAYKVVKDCQQAVKDDSMSERLFS